MKDCIFIPRLKLYKILSHCYANPNWEINLKRRRLYLMLFANEINCLQCCLLIKGRIVVCPSRGEGGEMPRSWNCLQYRCHDWRARSCLPFRGRWRRERRSCLMEMKVLYSRGKGRWGLRWQNYTTISKGASGWSIENNVDVAVKFVIRLLVQVERRKLTHAFQSDLDPNFDNLN